MPNLSCLFSAGTKIFLVIIRINYMNNILWFDHDIWSLCDRKYDSSNYRQYFINNYNQYRGYYAMI